MVLTTYLSTNMALVIPTIKQLSEHKACSIPEWQGIAAMPSYRCCLAQGIEGWNVKCTVTSSSRWEVCGMSQMYKTTEELSAKARIYYDS